jgi:hypothetical protein
MLFPIDANLALRKHYEATGEVAILRRAICTTLLKDGPPSTTEHDLYL